MGIFRETGLKKAMPASLAALLGLFLAVGATGQPRTNFESIAPESATGRSEKQVTRAASYMNAAATPHAAEAGAEIMAMGGSAVDAAIATALVLNLVEPQSAGIGGGGFMLGRSCFVDPLLASGDLVAPFAAKIKSTEAFYLVERAGERLPRPAQFFRDWILAEAAG